ncbi:MAG: LacI family DNA-binding transcriptional regulator [Bacteroidales bacterium]|nr:LacI family DNA-binding transcriptional regulator [Bacteroidales bacterium]MBN2820354.1 LacI family DNA-binding transcriptional regulator [Bacteroidales bacterium]
MKSTPVTIKDIAKTLGISPSTVSRALKDHPDISPKTKKAVQELAKSLHYEPNAIALSLRSSLTKTIGVIIPQLVHYFFSSVISGIEEVAYNAGFSVLICQSNEDYEKELSVVHALLSKRVDGVLASISKTTHNFDHYEEVRKSNTPLVFYDRVCNIPNTDRVIVDDYTGAYKAVKHLVNVGCKRIAHLATSQELLIGRNRRSGYIQALKDSGIEIDEEIILRCDTDEHATKCIPYLLSLEKKIDGIFAVNDLTAISAMSIIKGSGYSIPEDIAIAGFSNSNYAKMTYPPLTSVEQQGFTMGKRAAEMLIERIQSDVDIETRVEQIKTELIVRGSTQR